MRRALPEISELRHITAQELGENFNEILTEILDMDTAYVVVAGNKSYVLCPGEWICENNLGGIKDDLLHC